ncbi:hypothetical protein WYG_1206 [Citrobacter sp. A1]|nr:hypothetical protein WYG_1206 [Citrobacter sp. A1]EKU34759.1 hypothetical protein B397_2138 [Citrobacter sp. L17]
MPLYRRSCKLHRLPVHFHHCATPHESGDRLFFLSQSLVLLKCPSVFALFGQSDRYGFGVISVAVYADLRVVSLLFVTQYQSDLSGVCQGWQLGQSTK